MQSVHVSLAGIAVGLLLVLGVDARYDLDKLYEPNRVSGQGDFLSPRTQLARLFSRLQNLERNALEDRTKPDWSKSRSSSYDDNADNPSYYDFGDVINNSAEVGSLRKRQSSTGAQICIWKVCPPSPWRRAAKPGKSG